MSLRHLKRFNPKHDATSFNKLPFEVLNGIVAHLSKVDQVCLALTCKPLWICFQSNLEAQNLELSRFIPDESRSRCSGTFYSAPRVELLHQIQNKRWKLCRMCWKLHRISALGSSKILVSKGALPYKPSCMPFAGMIDICPCLKYEGELDFFRTVRYVEMPTGLPRSVLTSWIWTFISPERWEGPRHVSSVRAFNGYEYSSLYVSTVLYWESDTNTLLVESMYSFEEHGFLKRLLSDEERSTQRFLAERGIQPPPFYEHDNTQAWLEQFFREAGMNDLNLNDTYWTWTSPALCSECRSCDERGRKRWSFKDIKRKVRRDLELTGKTGKSLASKLRSIFGEFSKLKRKDVP